MDIDFSIAQNLYLRKWPLRIVCIGMGYVLALLCGCQPSPRLVHATPVSPMRPAPGSVFPPDSPAKLANEWRQTGASSAHSRSLSGTLAPPLRTVWRTPLSFRSFFEFAASGDTLYVAGVGWPSSRFNTRIAAINAKNSRLRWVRSGVTVSDDLSDAARLIATERGVFASINGQLQYLRASDGRNLLSLSIPMTDSSQLCGMIDNNIYVYPNESSDMTGFQTLDATTLKLSAETSLMIPGSDSYGLNPGDSHGYFFPGNIGSLFINPENKSKIRLFMQDVQNLVTTEGPPTYHPHGLVFNALNNGLAIGGGGRAYLQLSAGDYVSLEAINPHSKIIWKYQFPTQFRKDYWSRASYDCLAATDTHVFVQVGSLLYAFASATGHVVWTAPYKRPLFLGPIGPVVMGNVLYVLSASTPIPNKGSSVANYQSRTGWADSLRGYSVATGRLLWSRHIGHRLISFIGHRGALYLVDSIPHKHDQNYDYFLMKLAHKQ